MDAHTLLAHVAMIVLAICEHRWEDARSLITALEHEATR